MAQVGVGRRGRIAVGAALTAVALLVAAILAKVAANPAPGGAATARKAAMVFDADCRAAMVVRSVPADLPLALDLGDGMPGARVYAGHAGEFVCERFYDRTLVHGVTRDAQASGGGGSWRTDGLLTLGVLPVGVTRVDLRLPAGGIGHATVGSGYWGYLNTQAVARTADGVVTFIDPGVAFPLPIVTFYRPGSTFVSDINDIAATPGQSIDQVCRAEVAKILAEAVGLTVTQRSTRVTPIYTDGDPGVALDVLGSDRVIVDCDRTGGGDTDALFESFAGRHDEITQVFGPPSRWPTSRIIGHAPAGTQAVTITSTDGLSVSAALVDGFYVALWPQSHGDVARVRAYAAGKVYTWIGGTTTVTGGWRRAAAPPRAFGDCSLWIADVHCG